MEPINVLVNDQIPEEMLPRIAAIDSRINVTHIGKLLTAEGEGDPVAKQLLDGLLEKAEVYAGMRVPANLLSRSPRLKWVQMVRAGVEEVLTDEFRTSSVLLTNVAGVHSFAPAESAILMCLAHAKNIRESYRQKESRLWEPYSVMSLRGKTMGIVGFGTIGRKTARVAKAFEMWVIGTRRSLTKPGKARWADLMLPIANLDQLLAESDYVVVTVPYTPETHHLIGQQQLNVMKKEALLVNVGRGPVVDESALAAALKQGRIAGAALDVFEKEPLPQDSPLWDLPNLIYAPHIAGHIVEYPGLVRELFVRNLERYVKGERLSGVVDKKRGY